MGAKRRVAPTPEVTTTELEGAVRRFVAELSGLSRAELKKRVAAAYKGQGDRGIEVARSLAVRGELFRWSKGATKERFFAQEPTLVLARAATRILEEGPLEELAFKRRLDGEGAGLADLYKEWLPGAVAREELFWHAAPAGAKRGIKKRLAAQPEAPDPAAVLKKVFLELRKALGTKAGKRLSSHAVLSALAAELGAPLPDAAPTGSAPASDHPAFIGALRELSAANVAGGLLPIRDLRAALRWGKPRFDAAALRLASDGLVTLHHHDFPSALSPSEREDLVADERGTVYVGIALRRHPTAASPDAGIGPRGQHD